MKKIAVIVLVVVTAIGAVAFDRKMHIKADVTYTFTPMEVAHLLAEKAMQGNDRELVGMDARYRLTWHGVGKDGQAFDATWADSDVDVKSITLTFTSQ